MQSYNLVKRPASGSAVYRSRGAEQRQQVEISAMTQVVERICPNCQRSLRIPPAWLARVIRCRHCREYLRGRLLAPGERPRESAPHPQVAPEPIPRTPGAFAEAPGPVGYHPPASPILIDQEAIPEAKPVVSLTTYPRARTGRYRPPQERGSGSTVLLLASLCLGLIGLIAALLIRPNWFAFLRTNVSEPRVDAPKSPNPTPLWVPEIEQFPRRMLAINVSNYLFANPIHSGRPSQSERDESDYWDIHKIIAKLAARWRIPRDQVFELSDSMVGPQSPPPLKSIIEETLQRFCSTCRAQDHILFFFTGHAVELDGEAYLVPIEGELDQPATLIPLQTVYTQLAECAAQEKLVILDVGRFNPERGQERAGGGPISEALDQAIHTPPPGVRVWSSCSAQQSSWEYEYNVDRRTGVQIWGSVFLSQFLYASRQGKLGAGIQRPGDPLPVASLVETVNQNTREVVNNLAQATQQPRLSGNTLLQPVAFDASEALPARFPLPEPPPHADPQWVAAIIDTIRVPPIKIQRREQAELPISRVYPFPIEEMRQYPPDGFSEEAILGKAEQFPIRAITLRARNLLRELRRADPEGQQALPEEFRGETSEEAKQRILAIQRVPAQRIRQLRELLNEMRLLAEVQLANETSARWIANFLYIRAQTMARYAYLNEYNLMLGQVRKDELPGLGAGQTGWRLASSERMQSAREIRDVAREADDLYEQLIEEFPDTPWAILAKRAQATSLGLLWQPASFGG